MGLLRTSLNKVVQLQLMIREASLSKKSGRSNSGNGIVGIGSDNPSVQNFDNKNVFLPNGAFYINSVAKQSVVRLYSGVDVKPGTFPEYPLEKNRVDLAKQFFLEGGVKDLSNNPNYTRLQPGGGSRFGESNHAYGSEKFRANAHRGYGIVPMPGITDVDIRTVSEWGSLKVAKINFECHSLSQLEIMEMLYMRPGYPLLLEWGWAPYISNEGIIKNILPKYDPFWSKDSVMWDMQKEIAKQKYELSGNYDALLGFVKNFDWKSRDDGGFECTTELMGYGEIMVGLQGRNDLVPPKTTITFASDDEISDASNMDAKYKIYGFDSILPDWIFEGNGNEASLYTMDNFLWVVSSLMYYKDFNGFRNNPTLATHLTHPEHLDSFNGVNNKTRNPFQKGVFKAIKMLIKLSGNQREYRSTIDFIDDYLVKQGDQYTQNSFYSMKVRVKDNDGNDVKDKDGNYKYKLREESKKKRQEATGVQSQQFIRWDFICELLNHFYIPQFKGSSTDVEPITKWDYMNRDGRGMIEMAASPQISKHHSGSVMHGVFGEYQLPLGGGYMEATLDIHKSFDPDYCLMPAQFFRDRTDGSLKNRHYHQDLDGLWADKSGHEHIPRHGVHYIRPMKEHGKVGTRTQTLREKDYAWYQMEGLQGYFMDESKIDDNAIGLTYINANFLLDKYKEHKYSDDPDKPFSMFDFVTDIWKTISSEACNSYHKFIVHTEDDSSTCRVVDLTVDPSLGPPSDIFQFKVQSDNSIVRDFKMTSAIPDSISSVIATTAQSPNTFDAASTTLAAFSSNIDSRFSGYAEDNDWTREEQFDNLFSRFVNLQWDVWEYMSTINGLDSWNHLTKKYKNQGKAAAVELLQTMHQLNALSARFVDIQVVSKLDLGYGEGKRHDGSPYMTHWTTPDFLDTWENVNNTEIVPIEVDLKIDGIGGVRIGDVIKIDNITQGPRLPKGYNRDDVFFVVFGIRDKINSDQDWEQTLRCKMTIMGNRNTNPSKFTSHDVEGQGKDSKKKKDLDDVSEIGTDVECNRNWASHNSYPWPNSNAYDVWVANPIRNYSDELVAGSGQPPNNYKQYDPIGNCACKNQHNRTGCRKHNGIDIGTRNASISLCVKKGVTLGKIKASDIPTEGGMASDFPFFERIKSIEFTTPACPETHDQVDFPQAAGIYAGTDGTVSYRTGVKGYGGLLKLEGELPHTNQGNYIGGYYESGQGLNIDEKSLYNSEHVEMNGTPGADLETLTLTQQFGHVQQDIWKNGEKVTKGTIIGISGGASNQPNKGNSDGPHVHYETKLKGGRFKGGFVNPYIFTHDSEWGSSDPSLVELFDFETGRSHNCTEC